MYSDTSVHYQPFNVFRPLTDWSIIDSFQTTIYREDGLFLGDVRHYGSEVVEAMVGELLMAILKVFKL
jgi:hypothetical protein